MPGENVISESDNIMTAVSDAVLAGTSSWFGSSPLIATLVSAALLLFAAWLILFVVRSFVVRNAARLITRGKSGLTAAFERRRVLHHLALLVPVLIIRAGLPFIPGLPDAVTTIVQRVLAVLVIAITARAIADIINAFGDVYAGTARAKERPLKGYLQAIILVLYLVTAVIIVATLIDRSPTLILGGLGAASAVLLLIFSDTILSLVASMQLTSNDLIRVGDWIEMPQMNADGDVVEINLNTVKVQNWDKTFTVIPAHMFLNNSYRNWRGMQESGGRRIKRSIMLDMSSIRFLTETEIGDLKRFDLLAGYLSDKEAELQEYNRQADAGPDDLVNARRLTNVGTFRAYVTNYLLSNPLIHKDMTFLVRQLAPTAEGLPLELYVFTTDVRWAYYEGVQADVFDHLLAILPEFGLRVFQNPSGADMRSFRDAASAREPAVINT
jgi:miniconductance mechanosensitive channel